MDIKAKIDEIVAKVKGDDGIKDKFMSDPMGTAKSLVGENVDNDTMNKIIDGVKSALTSGGIGEIKNKITGAIGGLFGKS